MKICIDNCNWLISGSHITQLKMMHQGASRRKLPKDFAGKNLQMAQQKLTMLI